MNLRRPFRIDRAKHRPPTPGSTTTEHVSRVADYYNANTRRFLRVGASNGGEIHRGVWMPGTANATEAADVVNRLVVERLRGHAALSGGRVLDLGCGIGATMIRIAGELDLLVAGVTISRVQAEIAAARFAAEGLADRCNVVCGDFADLPADPKYHAMVAIESVAHSPSMAELIGSLASRLHAGGRMILCDDWITDKDRGLAAREACIAQFRAGWRIGVLHTVPEIAAIGEAAGLPLVEDLDLTPYLHLGRPRDRLIALAVGGTKALPRIHHRLAEIPFWGNMIGGSALQTGLSRGWIEYRMLVFDRPSTRTPSDRNGSG